MMTYSKKQLQEKLDGMNAQYDPDASAAELKALYDELKTATAEESKVEQDTVSNNEVQENEENIDAPEANEHDDTPVNGSPAIMVRQTCEKLYLRSTPEKVSGNEIAILLGNREYATPEIGEEWTYLFGVDGYVASAFIEEV